MKYQSSSSWVLWPFSTAKVAPLPPFLSSIIVAHHEGFVVGRKYKNASFTRMGWCATLKRSSGNNICSNVELLMYGDLFRLSPDFLT
jgi:hypothetical protein